MHEDSGQGATARILLVSASVLYGWRTRRSCGGTVTVSLWYIFPSWLR